MLLSTTKDRPAPCMESRSALQGIAMRGITALSSLIRHWILKPDVEVPGHVEPAHMLSLTGFSGVWE